MKRSISVFLSICLVVSWEYVRPVLETALVSSDGYTKVANSKKINNPKAVLELSHFNNGKEVLYTLAIRNSQMIVAANTMNYACLYNLKNGKKLVDTLENVLK